MSKYQSEDVLYMDIVDDKTEDVDVDLNEDFHGDDMPASDYSVSICAFLTNLILFGLCHS